MQRRYADRPPIVIADEYDVQDLIRTILVAMFDDVRPEEWTPSYAGIVEDGLPAEEGTGGYWDEDDETRA